MEAKQTCFVVQGFGEKTDFVNGRKLNLDASYLVIKEAVEAAGLQCIRADEIQHSGVIDKPMFEQLLDADLVIADLSTYNVNAAYELGVRHALRPHATIIVAENKFRNPFDVSHITIRSYEHLGPDLGNMEARRFKDELKEAITAILEQQATDSPVYTFLTQLHPPQEGDEEDAHAPESMTRGADETPPYWSADSAKVLLDQARQAMKHDQFDTAKQMFSIVHRMRPHDAYVAQQLALSTYKSKQPDPEAALWEAHGYLETLEPDISNDPETLGLWGAVHKRLWDLNEDPNHLEESIKALERGFRLRNDYYNGINLAFLLNVRASRSEPAEAIADFVLANRIRRQVSGICEATLNALHEAEQEAPPDTDEEKAEMEAEKYWILATLWEAAFGLGDEAAVEKWQQEATAAATADWMVVTTRNQLAKLATLLDDSPLKHIEG